MSEGSRTAPWSTLEEPRTKAEYVRWLIATQQVDDFPLGAEDQELVPDDLPGDLPMTWAQVYPETV